MIMESPVRICLGAALVANLLLLSGTVTGNALPVDATPSVRDERVTRLVRANTTYPSRRHKTPDVALNELHPKESLSDENTDKNAKYKDRGRVRFSKSSTTVSPFRRFKSSTSSTPTASATTATALTAKLIIVTPTPEVKKPAQIIDSMRNYKRTKMPLSSSSTTSMPSSVKSIQSEEEEEYESEEHEEDEDNFEKYTSSKFDSNFFTIPSYNDDVGPDSEGSDNKVKSEFSRSPFSTFSNYFPELSNGPKANKDDEPYKHDSFFNFDADLTTPKNDFFDKKYQRISQSIIKNLDTMKNKTKPLNATNVRIVKQRNPIQQLNNNSTKPSNTSTIFIKNTKEIRLSDNDGADTNNKELSDIKGTSVYYEMSVLSTETYNIDHSNDDDCDNDTLPSEPTASTSEEQETGSLKATQSTILASTKSYPDPPSESISTLSSNYLPFSTIGPSFFTSPNAVSFSTQNNGVSSTEKTTHIYSSTFTRNRSYSKRLNLTGSKESPNNVTPKTENTSNRNWRNPTRKFHYTTPKTKPIWMAPTRNATRNSYHRSTVPTTIYSEYFDITDKISSTTLKPRQSQKTSLTTVSSEIDPVLQSDVSGVKKVVHSQSISDNSIPTLWKRGSTKFSSTSTATSTEVQDGISDLEIPPTLTAWALASLRSPPSMASPVNATTSTQKSVDENELQKVGEVTDKKETTTSSTSTTTVSAINNDIISEKITDIDQNRLPWRPVIPLPSSTKKPEEKITETKSERLPAESNISIQSSAKPMPELTTEKIKDEYVEKTTETSNEWVSAAVEEQTTTEVTETEAIPPVDAAKSTGFESITKLPSGLTTPQDETIGSEEQETATDTSTTTDYEITTIRFSYVPTESTESTESEISTKTTSAWHPVFPTRTKMTTIKDEPITTYRPRYVTTTDVVEDITTIIPETTSPMDISSQNVKTVTEMVAATTVNAEEIKETTTEKQSSKPTTTTKDTASESTESSFETSTVIEVVTEINTEIEREKSSTEHSSTEGTSTETETPPSEIKESSSEENSDSNEVITQETTKPPSPPTTTTKVTTTRTTTEDIEIEVVTDAKQTTTQEAKIIETTVKEESTQESTTEDVTKSVNDLEDLTSFNGDVTTEASSRVLAEEAGAGAAIAIAVSTIGVIALVLLVGLLLVVRRRGRRGVYAQRCTPVSLDAYSLDSVSVGHRKGNHRLRASKRSYGNPAYDDEVTSHPMQYAALANFALDMESMSAEFTEIPSKSVRPDEVPPGCEDKNRYSNVLPLPETRVPLKRIGNDPTTEYINANFITGPGNIRNYYIACQAPLANTVTDFWRMVWEQNSRVLVMLTEYMENGVEKCYEYLPPSEVSDNKRSFGDFQVVLMKREQRDKYAVSSVQLINMATRTCREVTHLWYFWPAKGVPDDYESVMDFLSEMRSYMKLSQTAKEYDEEGVEVIYGDQNRSSFHNLSKLRSDDSSSGNGVNVYSPARAEEMMRKGNVTNGTLGRMKAASEVEGVRPCVVICASGAGRSAAIIAADICARALAASAADVPRVVREIRQQRPHSLTNRHHYIFLYKLLSEYGSKLMGVGVDTI